MESSKQPGRGVSRRGALASLAAAFACVAQLAGPVARAQPAIASGGGDGPLEAGSERDRSRSLPLEVEELLEAEPLPPVSISPRGRYVLLVRERQLVSLDHLAEPAIRIAGRSIDPRTASAHAPLEYYGLTLFDLATGEETPLVLPRGAIVGYPDWSPDGSRFAFTLSNGSGTEVWIGEPAERRVRRLVHSINATLGKPCAWNSDSRRLLCLRFPSPKPRGPVITIAELVERTSQAPGVGQPVVLNEERVRDLLESQLELIDSESGQRYSIGAPAAIEAAEPAPAGAFLLVTRLLEPYPSVAGVDAVARVTEVWDRFGNVVATLPDAARAAQWQADRPATLVWAERHEGRDRVMLLSAPYAADAVEGFEVPHRFSGLRWIGNSGAALISDYIGSAGRTELWQVELGGGKAPRLVTGYSSSTPRAPVMTTNAFGQQALLTYDGGFYLRGERRDGGLSRPYLERVELDTGARREVWSAGPDGYETVVDLLSPDAAVLLTRHETAASAPNYFVSSSAGRHLKQITRFEHPAPALAQARRLALRYERDDGVKLGASLYLPPGRTADARLPLVVWAYPRNVAAGGTTELPAAPIRFPTFERAFRLFFLLRGYAVLDDVSMPIVGAEDSANDTFIQQVVADAEAAIRAASETGYIDASRVGVAGHSYGAFMVANLLAHSHLFSAGIALSGAYNRTLTPFGFQTEHRTLWEAPDTYLAMSPLLYSHQVDAPLLLVHGLDDDNGGTSPLQSTQFYTAIRGNGGNAELLLLPWEGHSYRARESVLRTASTMLDWFDRYLKDTPRMVAQKEADASLRPPL